MAISTLGIGSGIDVNSIVSQLMALERRPLDMLNQRKSTYNSELSAYGTIKSDLAAIQTAMAGLKDSTGFDVFKATPADSTFFTATADSTAIAGSHTVTVGQLAQSQKLVKTTKRTASARLCELWAMTSSPLESRPLVAWVTSACP